MMDLKKLLTILALVCFIGVSSASASENDEAPSGTLNIKRVKDSVNDSIPDSNRFVTFRGDTIPIVLTSRKIGRFDRKLYNYLYLPKGIWSFGLTASYGGINTEDMDMLGLITGMTISGNMYSVRPSVQYFIQNNMAVGLRLSYSKGTAGIKSFGVDVGDDMSFNLKDISYTTESYTAAFTYRNYFGIAAAGRFAIFNEVELAFSSGNTDFVRPFDGALKTTHATHMAAELNFSPGVSVLVMKNVGFNVSFGVFGFKIRNEKQFIDNEPIGNRLTSGANFRFNIFNINFGLAVNI